MKRFSLAVCMGLLVTVPGLIAQAPTRLVQTSGVLRDATGAVRSGPVVVTFAIYASQEGGAALWRETQTVQADADGKYVALLGLTQPEGLPVGLFSGSENNWLTVAVDGGPEGPRAFWASVPYSLKAADAETVGGLPAAAFLLTPEYQKVASGETRPLQNAADGDSAPVASGGTLGSDPGPIANTVLTNSDGVIRNSTCTGLDCPDSPAFDDSTLLLMENNTRIKFGDTSVSPFPANDWEIEANSNLSGGANYLGFNDCGTADNDGGCASDLVFAVEAGVRQFALYVESDGDVGFGTSNPVVNLHMVDGNTPTMRLDQDTSSGFAAQSWDVAGNETSFFIRDVTNGSTLPFRIFPGAVSSALAVNADSSVSLAKGPLTLKGSAGDWQVQNNNATGRLTFFSPGGGATTASFKFDRQATENLLRVGVAGASTVDVNGTLTVNGTFNNLSSRQFKNLLADADGRAVLDNIASLPLFTWAYKNEGGVRHFGPVAEDFFAHFGLGTDAQHISPADLAGVALAASQALNTLLDEKDAEITVLREQYVDLKERHAGLQERLANLEAYLGLPPADK